MNKIITIEKPVKKHLSILAAQAEKSLKKYIEDLLINHVNQKK